MFQVEVYHHDKDIVRGDLEDKLELLEKEIFNTRKSAKAYIERCLSGKPKDMVDRFYRKGDTSTCYYFTGVKWQHENSGEMMEEYYKYILSKVTPK